LDLATLSRDELRAVALSDPLIIYLPLPSIGVTNSHIDICSDFVVASWAAERLASCAARTEAEEEYVAEHHQTRVKLILYEPNSRIRETIDSCVLVFQGDEELEPADLEHRQSLCDSIIDYEQSIEATSPAVPEIVDWYFANLISGANYEYQSEAPEYYEEQIRKHPERRLGFYKSAFSGRLGADAYTSPNSWVISASLDIDQFFRITGQRYRLEDFTPGSVFLIDGRSYSLAGGEILHFPMSQYFKSRVCTGLRAAPDDDWPLDRFDWTHAVFTFSPYWEAQKLSIPETFRGRAPARESCLVHRSGSMIIVDDGEHRHFLYDTRFLSQSEIKRLHEVVCQLSQSLGGTLGISEANRCDWASLDDETFERLCYDLIVLNPRFDYETIKKMGKSRSRDGGRDIVVYTTIRTPGADQKKWIFQCKLVRDGSSLSGSRLIDVGDMLDQFGAQGFGVITSTLIDATLYDKLDGVCGKRGIEQMHFSVLELERTLARYPTLRNRYFASK